MNRVDILLTDNYGNYYGKYIIKSRFVDNYILHKIKDIIFSTFKTDEIFFEDFSWNIIVVCDILDKELKNEDKSASCDFEYKDEYTLNVDTLYKDVV